MKRTCGAPEPPRVSVYTADWLSESGASEIPRKLHDAADVLGSVVAVDGARDR